MKIAKDTVVTLRYKVSEPSGRLIEASQREGDAAGARAAAERYLRDYPSGPHAKLASRLVASP